MSKVRHTAFINLFFITIMALMALTACASATPREGEVAEIDVEPTVMSGSVRGKVLTDSGEMVTAGIIVQDADGNLYRTTTNAQSGYNLQLPPGDYTLYFTRGIEYSIVTKTINVESFKKYYLQDVRLIHLVDPYSEGWIAADLHQHTYYSDGWDSVNSQLLGNISNGLYVGFLSDHNTAWGLAEWVQGNRLVANIDSAGVERPFNAFEAVEVTTEFGHYQSLGVGLTFDNYEVKMTEFQRAQSQAEVDQVLTDMIRYIADTIHRSGGLAQINHPYSASTMGFNYWEIADQFDTIEIWNGYFVPGDGRYLGESLGSAEQNYKAKIKWFELLNEVKNGAKFIPATGGSDNHDSTSPYSHNPALDPYSAANIADYEISNMQGYLAVYEMNGRYNGNPTTYLHIDGELSLESVLTALKQGNSFITNGPIIFADVKGRTYGETVDLNNAKSITLNIDAFARDGLVSLNIIKNGEIIQSIDVDATNYQARIKLDGIQPGDWIVLEGMGTSTHYCITNPIFFQ